MTFEEWVTRYQTKHNVTFSETSLKALEDAWSAGHGSAMERRKK